MKAPVSNEAQMLEKQRCQLMSARAKAAKTVICGETPHSCKGWILIGIGELTPALFFFLN